MEEEAYKTVLHSDLYQVVYSTISRRIGLAIVKLCDYPDEYRATTKTGKLEPRTTFFSVTERTIYFLIRLQILYLKCLYFVLT